MMILEKKKKQMVIANFRIKKIFLDFFDYLINFFYLNKKSL